MSQYPPKTKRGFTLVELLIVISVLAILSGLAIAVLRGAQEDAFEARTITQNTRISQFLESRWEDYEVRVLSIRLRDFTDGGVALTRRQIVELRKRIIAELIRVEVPTRFDDIDDVVNDFPSPDFKADFSGYVDASLTPISTVLNDRVPSLFRRFARKTNGFGNTTYEQAECLYMILESIVDLNSSGLDAIFDGEIGDLDGDGFPEVLDKWGTPLGFIVGVNPDRDNPGVNYLLPALTAATDLEEIKFLVWSYNIPK